MIYFVILRPISLSARPYTQAYVLSTYTQKDTNITKKALFWVLWPIEWTRLIATRANFICKSKASTLNKPCCRTLCVIRTTLRVLLVCYVRYARFPQMRCACVSLCLRAARRGSCCKATSRWNRGIPCLQIKNIVQNARYFLVEPRGFEGSVPWTLP